MRVHMYLFGVAGLHQAVMVTNTAMLQLSLRCGNMIFRFHRS